MLKIKLKTVKINQIIKDLLLTNDTVVIPGLGAFVTQYQSAEIISAEGAIQPPTKSVLFNPKISNDSTYLLENYLVSKLNITAHDSKIMISDFVQATDAKLKMKGEVEIDNIGILYSDVNDKVAFKQSSKDSLLLENYGMTKVQIPEANEKAQISSTKKSTTKAKTKTKSTTVNQTNASSSKTLKRVLIALPIIALLVLIIVFNQKILNFGENIVDKLFKKAIDEKVDEKLADNNKTENQDDLQIELNEKDDDTLVLSNDNKVDDNKADDTKSENKKDKDKKDDETVLKEENVNNVTKIDLGTTFKNYYLVVGSFSTKENAQSRVKELVNQGYSAIILTNEPKKFRVSIGGFDYVTDAVAEYKTYVAKNGNKDIWLLKNK